MYVRLSYGTVQQPFYAFSLLAYLVNNPSITTIAALQSSSAPNVNLLTGSNSVLVRTNNPSNVQGHINNYSGNYLVDFRFQVYDASDRYWYFQNYSTGAMASHNMLMGDGYQSTWTTNATSVSSGFTVSNQIVQVSALANNYTDYFFHITDKGIMWAAQGQTGNTVTGFPTTYSSVANYIGPFLCGQYTRYDLFNTNSNNIVPVLSTKSFVATTNPVYGTSSRHFTALNNPFAANSEVGHQVHSALNMNNTSSVTAVTRSIAQNIHLGVGCRTTDGSGALTVASSSTTSATGVYGKAVTTTAGERYPTPDNTGYGFALLPITWSLSNFMMAGGNMSDQTGVYIFNGDYVAGDEFVYNSKTYVIWPLWDGVSNRIGLAVPKE